MCYRYLPQNNTEDDKLGNYWSPQLGFESAISRLQVHRSTTELYRLHVKAQKILHMSFTKLIICEYREKTTPSQIFMPCHY